MTENCIGDSLWCHFGCCWGLQNISVQYKHRCQNQCQRAFPSMRSHPTVYEQTVIAKRNVMCLYFGCGITILTFVLETTDICWYIFYGMEYFPDIEVSYWCY